MAHQNNLAFEEQGSKIDVLAGILQVYTRNKCYKIPDEEHHMSLDYRLY